MTTGWPLGADPVTGRPGTRRWREVHDAVSGVPFAWHTDRADTPAPYGPLPLILGDVAAGLTARERLQRIASPAWTSSIEATVVDQG